jgi:hypothetical protein
MSVVFMDSFDHYADILTKYDSNFQGAINTTPGKARTGIGCLEILSAAYGPGKTIRQVTDCLIADSFWCNVGSGGGNVVRVLMLGNEGGGAGYHQGECVGLVLNNDGSLSVEAGPSRGNFVWGTSAAGLYQFSAYNALALRTTIGPAATIRVWCNGVEVLTLTGIDTRNLHDTSKHYVDAISLLGPGGTGFNAYHDDLYVLDCSDAVNNQYLGALRIYAAVPDADGAVQWAPSVGASNFANVDSIPPDQATEFNSDGTSGDMDQYRHPLPAIPAGSQIFAVQHCQDLQVDSGALSVTSDVAGVANASPVALSNGWKIYPWPYDTNPFTGSAWAASDFPLFAGPKVA